MKQISQEELDQKIQNDFHGDHLVLLDAFENIKPTLDNKAKLYLTNMLQTHPQYVGIRISVVGGGCHGLRYQFDVIEYVTDISHLDLKICDIPLVVIDEISIKYLWGAHIKHSDNGIVGGLEIENPRAKQMCGCGTSFTYE